MRQGAELHISNRRVQSRPTRGASDVNENGFVWHESAAGAGEISVPLVVPGLCPWHPDGGRYAPRLV